MPDKAIETKPSQELPEPCCQWERHSNPHQKGRHENTINVNLTNHVARHHSAARSRGVFVALSV